MTKINVPIVAFLLGLISPFVAAETTSTSTISEQQRLDVRSAEALFTRYLAAWRDGNDSVQDMTGIFSDRAYIELTLAQRTEWTIHIDGPQAIAEYVNAMQGAAIGWRFDDVHFFPTLETGIVFAQYDAKTTRKDGRNDLQFRNLVVIELNGDRIARLRDFNGAPLVIQDLISDGKPGSKIEHVASYR